MDALLDPCQFENADAVENFSISTPRPAMTVSVANAKRQFEQAQAKVAFNEMRVAELYLAQAIEEPDFKKEPSWRMKR